QTRRIPGWSTDDVVGDCCDCGACAFGGGTNRSGCRTCAGGNSPSCARAAMGHPTPAKHTIATKAVATKPRQVRDITSLHCSEAHSNPCVHGESINFGRRRLSHARYSGGDAICAFLPDRKESPSTLGFSLIPSGRTPGFCKVSLPIYSAG